MTEKQLIEGCINNDSRCQKQVYDLYSSQMYSICLRYCTSPDIAADALQNAFIKIFKNINAFRNEGDLGAWIRRIVVRCALDQIKIEKKHLSDDFDQLTDSSTNYFEMEDQITYETLLSLLSKMPNGYRLVFSMAVLDDMNHKEIADTLQITESTSRTQLLKARKFLQNLIVQKSNLYI